MGIYKQQTWRWPFAGHPTAIRCHFCLVVWNHGILNDFPKKCWLVLSNICFFSIIIIWDVIPTPLTNSIIFQDVFLTTNQLVFTILTYMGIYGKKKNWNLEMTFFFWGWWESIGIGGTLLSDKTQMWMLHDVCRVALSNVSKRLTQHFNMVNVWHKIAGKLQLYPLGNSLFLWLFSIVMLKLPEGSFFFTWTSTV